jgi:uncharacterized protein YpuA (DUF1002 family)
MKDYKQLFSTLMADKKSKASVNASDGKTVILKNGKKKSYGRVDVGALGLAVDDQPEISKVKRDMYGNVLKANGTIHVDDVIFSYKYHTDKNAWILKPVDVYLRSASV